MTIKGIAFGLVIMTTIGGFAEVGQNRTDLSDDDRLADVTFSGGINTNKYSYSTELGRVKSKQEVIIGIREKNFVMRGVNAWTDDDDDEFSPVPNDIYGTGIKYGNMTGVSYDTVSGLTIKDPVTGGNIQAAYYFRDAGYEFVSILGRSPWFARYVDDSTLDVSRGGCYFGQTWRGVETTLPFSFGTNATKVAECRTMAFPDKTASASTLQLKNAPDLDGAKMPAIADREWVLNLVTNILNSAGYNVNVTVNADGTITAVTTP